MTTISLFGLELTPLGWISALVVGVMGAIALVKLMELLANRGPDNLSIMDIWIPIAGWVVWMGLSKGFSLITGWPFESSINPTGVILVIALTLFLWGD